MIHLQTVERRRSVTRSWPPETEPSYWRTRPVALWWAVMSRSDRSGGRGVPRVAIPVAVLGRVVVPAPDREEALILLFRVVSVLAAQLFDFATFTLMVGRHGIGAEMNPLVAQGFAGFGMPMAALMKILLVVLLASTIVVLDRRKRLLRGRARDIGGFVTVFAVVGGLVGGISNVITL
jgi:hypothetical protein